MVILFINTFVRFYNENVCLSQQSSLRIYGSPTRFFVSITIFLLLLRAVIVAIVR